MTPENNLDISKKTYNRRQLKKGSIKHVPSKERPTRELCLCHTCSAKRLYVEKHKEHVKQLMIKNRLKYKQEIQAGLRKPYTASEKKRGLKNRLRTELKRKLKAYYIE